MPPMIERSSVMAWRPCRPALNEPISPKALRQVVQLICSLKPPRMLARTRFVTIAPWRSPPSVRTESRLESLSPMTRMFGPPPRPIIWADALPSKPISAAAVKNADTVAGNKPLRAATARDSGQTSLPAAEQGMSIRTATDPDPAEARRDGPVGPRDPIGTGLTRRGADNHIGATPSRRLRRAPTQLAPA